MRCCLWFVNVIGWGFVGGSFAFNFYFMNKLALGALALSLAGGCAEAEKTSGDVPVTSDVRHKEVLACGEDPCFGLSESILAKIGNATGSVPSVTDGCRRELSESVAGCMAIIDSHGGTPGLRDGCMDYAAENVEFICGE